MIESWREELVEEVTICSVEFDRIVAGPPYPPRRVHEVALDGVDLVGAQRPHRFAGGGMFSSAWTYRIHAEHGTP